MSICPAAPRARPASRYRLARAPAETGPSPALEAAILDSRTLVTAQTQPRARGAVRIVAGARGLEGLRQEGSLRALFPRGRIGVEACLINTAGGITGGDRFSVSATARAGARLILSTQAAERAYRAQPGQTGRLEVSLSAEPGAVLHWLPQETILYEGCALDRTLRISLAREARLLMVEPVLFGRMAMGEALRAARFHDRVEITRDGAPVYLDAVRLEGDIAAQLARPAVADGARAMAALVLVAPGAEAHLAPVRALLPATGGASLLGPDMLVLRLLAPDAMALRRSLLPVLDRLTGDTLPTAWRL